MFSLAVICYLFFGGCGAGVLLLASITGHAQCFMQMVHPEEEHVIQELQARSFIVATLVIAFSALFLLADLGRPERMLLLFTSQARTWITFGSWTIIFVLLFSFFLALVLNTGTPKVSQRLIDICKVFAMLAALALMTYTGMFLFQMGVQVKFWNSWLLVVLFVLSAISCGFAVVYLLFPFMPNCDTVHTQAVFSHRIHLVVVVLETLVLGAFLFRTAHNASTAASVELLFHGSLSTWFLFGVLVCGLAVPLIGGLYAQVFRSGRLPLVVEVSTLVGAFALRYCLVMAGLH